MYISSILAINARGGTLLDSWTGCRKDDANAVRVQVIRLVGPVSSTNAELPCERDLAVHGAADVLISARTEDDNTARFSTIRRAVIRGTH